MRRDFLLAFRVMRARPSFAAAVVLLLAIGIGPNVAIFSVIRAMLVRPLPFDRSDQLVWVWESAPRMGLPRSIVSPPDFKDWRDRSTSFQQLAAFRTWFYAVVGRDEPEQVWGVRVSVNFFEMLRVAPALGRGFAADEERPGHDGVVLISDGLWRRRFSADPSTVGTAIEIDGRSYTVVGILPAAFDVFGTSRQFDLWMPYDYTAGPQARDNYSLLIFGRLRDGVDVPTAQAELSSVAKALEREYPDTNTDRGVEVASIHAQQTEPIRPALLMLMTAVGFVLIIACANAANLLLARAVARQHEFAIRSALGASPFRLARQNIAEAILFSSGGAAIGLLFGAWTLQLMKVLLPSGANEIPRAARAGLDLPTVGIAVALSLVVAFLIGFVPALQRTRRSEASVLGGATRTTGDVRTGHTRSALIVVQVAMAVVLLLGAGLTMRSLLRLLDVAPGFTPENLLTMQVWLPEKNYPDETRVRQFLTSSLERIAALPGVQVAGGVNFLPFSGWGDLAGIRGTNSTHATDAKGASTQYADYRVVVGNYFRAAGIPIHRGRALDDSDRFDTEAVVVVNETFARRHWPNVDPLGRGMEVMFPSVHAPWRPLAQPTSVRVVGIAGDVHESGLGDPRTPVVYLAGAQFPSRLMRLTVRTSGDPMLAARSVQEALRSIDPRQAVSEVKTMERFLVESVARRRLNIGVLIVLAVVALAVAIGGIWSVVSYATAQRTREIGIRLTLGANPKNVLTLIVGQSLRPVLLGIALGLAGAFATARMLSGLLFGIGPDDPITYGAVGVCFVAIATVACWLPARRAARVDPVVALRCD